jgi:hypothetical protein
MVAVPVLETVNSNLSEKALIPRSRYSQQVLKQLHNGERLQVIANKGSVLIICHEYHAEVVGSKAAIGGVIDLRCRRLIPIGEVYFQPLPGGEERKRARHIRQKWTRCTQKVLTHVEPTKRATVILRILEKFCGVATTRAIPQDVLAQLVGVLPETMERVYQEHYQQQIHQNRQPDNPQHRHLKIV